MIKGLVSVIVPTRNRGWCLGDCLGSIKNQTYSNIEIVIVDGNSEDATVEVAKKYSDKVYIFDKKGDHRCAQRNLGVENADGEFVMIIDSDMTLDKNVICECVAKMNAATNIAGVIIPEESVGKGFWTQCKKLEKSFYVGVRWMEAARFFRKGDFQKVGGYDASMTSGEDWDLSQRVGRLGKIEHIDSFIFHNEGRISLLKTIKNKLYYASKISKYIQKNKNENNVDKQADLVVRYKLFLSQPKNFVKIQYTE